MGRSITDNFIIQFKRLSKSLFANALVDTKKCFKKASLGLLAIFLLSSAVVGCGNRNHLAGRYGYGGDGYRHIFGQNMPGQIIDTATGYNMNGHQVQLEFRRVDFAGGYNFNSANLRSGSVDIQGEVIFSDSINSSFSYYSHARYGGGRYGRGGHDPYAGGYGYDPCYIQPNQYLRVFSEPQFGFAYMEGNDFGEYELLAQGSYGELVRLSPVDPTVGASFLLGHGRGHGEVNLFMDVIVQRIDVPDAYCPERRVTFGS